MVYFKRAEFWHRTGYFEIGALLALDGQWQSLDNIRILMGAETTYRTRTALLDAVRAHAVQILDGSLEANKDTNPFLHGVPAILDALRSGQIECRVYDKNKFHAKRSRSLTRSSRSSRATLTATRRSMSTPRRCRNTSAATS